MKKFTLVVCLLTAGLFLGLEAQAPDGDWIIQKMDENFGSDNKIYVGTMTVHGRRGSRTITSKSWLRGVDQSFTEFLSPPREAGTKMLKLEDELWTYSPSTDRIIRISGHMLRQSVMGSDLSYEDMMEDPELSNIYDSQVVGDEIMAERDCWVLELVAKEGNKDIAYHTRKVWVDKERFISLREDRFARSGKLLKTTEVIKVLELEGRWIPSHIVFKDVLKGGKGTEMIIESMEFDADIPEHVFSKASLRR
ncbi:MAG: outer membrane lipoprotein-sorting protein [Candidatus Aminicenantaceae bacterium]